MPCAYAALMLSGSALARHSLLDSNHLDVLKRLAALVEQSGGIPLQAIRSDISADILVPTRTKVSAARRNPETVHSKPCVSVEFEPQLRQQLQHLARRPFSPMGGERFDRTITYCMQQQQQQQQLQHDRMPSPEEEH